MSEFAAFLTLIKTAPFMCEDCRVQNIARKISQFEEPREHPQGTRSRSEKTKGRKVRLDELNQAIKDFWQAFEWDEDSKARAQACKIPGHKGVGFACWHGMHDGWLKDRRKRMDKVFEACRKDGII